ncbi:ankyrin repeat protein [Pseudarthrobacter sp. PvP004]|uniref:ankyrin repeat domain-containing protein n=1 Tax=Pseudarthrobacter sp. PvP004 TaxID=2817850 RepID=UPI001AEB0B96|nr:ankyrin repeat domain-containing protein [Pseudarthrobacter sp. PvP004]MBP2267751.1 ankyrin repeat protein [Pseudarthrobacter sp. PvP004]
MNALGTKARVVGAGVLVLGLLSGCTTAAPSPSSPTPTQATPTQAASSNAGPGPASSAAVPAQQSAEAKLSPEAQIETDRLLILAAKANDAAKVRELIAAGGNVNAKDEIQDSAFLYAGAEGFNEVLQLTLAAGADVRSTNRYGGTALIPASEHGHTETVRILIAAGVPVDHVNNLGWTAMQEAILLNNGGPNQQDVVRQLLAAGATPDIRDPQGRTALQNAERLGFTEIAALIRNR